ncbi:MAG: hypothetical protein IK127_08460 [Clostridia bacterium]|nr:hypothetical protein [Clostridia bacterium]
MKRKLTVLLLILAALLALICCAYAEEDPIKVKLEFPDNPKSAFDGAGEVRVTITVKNISDRALPGPVTLYDPSSKPVESFGAPVLEVGASKAWEGTWMVTEEMLDEGKLAFVLHYFYYLEDGTVDEKSVAYRKPIRRVDAEPSVEMSRTITPTMAAQGQKITVTYEIANTGEVPVENVTITEHASMNLQAASVGTIQPGEKASHTFTVTMDKSDMLSGATVSYTGNGLTYSHQSEIASIRYGEVNLTAAISADKKGGVMGTQATLTITLTNKGKTDYEHITISDPVQGDLFSDLTVKAGQKETQTLTVDIDETRNYQFYVSGRDTEGVQVDMATNQLTITAISPDDVVDLELEITADRDSVQEFPGIVVFTAKVTNNSAAELTDVSLYTSGANFSERLTVFPSILPGETRTYTRDLNVSMVGDYQFMVKAVDQIGEAHEFKSNILSIKQASATPAPTSRVIQQPKEPTPIPRPTEPLRESFNRGKSQSGTGSGLSTLQIAGIVLLVPALIGLILLIIGIIARAKKAADHRAALDHLQVRSIRDYEAETDQPEYPQQPEPVPEQPVPQPDDDFEKAVEAAARRRRNRQEPVQTSDESTWIPERLKNGSPDNSTPNGPTQ